MSYQIIYSKKTLEDIPKLKAAGLETKVRNLIDLIMENPFQTPPTYEKLFGDMYGSYSRRINHQHRLVYQVNEERKQIKIVSMWSHYEF